MAIEYTNLFHSKALQSWYFGLKIYHLATMMGRVTRLSNCSPIGRWVFYYNKMGWASFWAIFANSFNLVTLLNTLTWLNLYISVDHLILDNHFQFVSLILRPKLIHKIDSRNRPNASVPVSTPKNSICCCHRERVRGKFNFTRVLKLAQLQLCSKSLVKGHLHETEFFVVRHKILPRGTSRKASVQQILSYGTKFVFRVNRP
jgi:hypothetical protein